MRHERARLPAALAWFISTIGIATILAVGVAALPLSDAAFSATSSNSGSTVAAAFWIGNVVDHDTGWEHGCAAIDDGTVRCWGRNDVGQLGDGTTTDHPSPVTVVGPGGTGSLSDVISVGLSKETSCAVKSDATAWCWGRNDAGQLGDGTTSDSNTPVQVVGVGGSGFLTGVLQIEGGERHSCARTSASSGQVFCWGENNDQQLGDGTSTNRSTPVQVVGVGGFGALDFVATIGIGRDHSCAAATFQTAYCWGKGANGRLGSGGTASSGSPIQVVGYGGSGALGGVTSIAAGDATTCARTFGYAACWGLNDVGQMGDGTTTSSTAPVAVTDVGGSGALSNVAEVGAGFQSACASKIDGTAYCWGWNSDGELGDGTTTQSLSPVQVVGLGGSGTLTDMAEVIPNTDSGAGDVSFACGRKNDGTVWCWGDNSLGTLGDGTTTGSLTPVESQT